MCNWHRIVEYSMWFEQPGMGLQKMVLCRFLETANWFACCDVPRIIMYMLYMKVRESVLCECISSMLLGYWEVCWRRQRWALREEVCYLKKLSGHLGPAAGLDQFCGVLLRWSGTRKVAWELGDKRSEEQLKGGHGYPKLREDLDLVASSEMVFVRRSFLLLVCCVWVVH